MNHIILELAVVVCFLLLLLFFRIGMTLNTLVGI